MTELNLLEMIRFHIASNMEFKNDIAPWMEVKIDKCRVSPISEKGQAVYLIVPDRRGQLLISPTKKGYILFGEYLPAPIYTDEDAETSELIDTIKILFYPPLRPEDPNFLDELGETVKMWVYESFVPISKEIKR